MRVGPSVTLLEPAGTRGCSRRRRDDGTLSTVCPFVKTLFRLVRQRATIVAMPESGTGTSQSLERGLAILSAFDSDRPLIGVSELSRELALSRSTAHRYIATLARLGYLQQDPDSKRYRLGPKVLDLGFSAINSMDVREISAPHLRRLSDETGHTVNLAILDGTDVVYIERCRTAQPGQREIDLNLHVGARLPAYCTAMGKAILAFVPEDRREAIIERIDFVSRGPNTITDPAEFRAELERIRVSGFAVNDEELAYGLRSIAAPIQAHSGEVLAALNLAVHRTMSTMDELIARFGPAVKQTAEDISLGMGHRLVPA
jgi:IclR family transcriptional regulator, pca regulon regulatory protein